MFSKLKKVTEKAFDEYSEKNCFIFDDGTNEVKATYGHVKSYIDSFCCRGFYFCGSICAISFDSNSQSVVNYFAAICFAVLKDSSFFVLDPKSQSWHSIDNSIRRLGIRTILCDDQFLSDLRLNTDCKIKTTEKVSQDHFNINFVCLESDAQEISVQLPDLVYVVQTSGTSGQRKTVFVSERSIWSNVEDFVRIFNLKDESIFAASPPTFDPFYVDLFLSISTGCCLVFIPSTKKFQKKQLNLILFDRQKVNYFQITPTLFKSLSSFFEKVVLSNDNFVKYIVIGGEIFPNLSPSIFLKSSTRVFNVYGVTEMSCWQSLTELKSSTKEKSSIFNLRDDFSQLLTGTRFDIVNSDGVCYDPEVDEEFEGEVHLYSETRICLVVSDNLDYSHILKEPANSFKVNTRDLAKVTRDGDVVLVGRTDDVIKMNGKRTSLSEIGTSIELVLEKPCVCLLTTDNKVIAFVAIGNEETARSSDFFSSLAKTLPRHLMPHQIVQIATFPMTINGKVDLDHLRATIKNESAKTKRHLSADLEKLFCKIWSKYLGVFPSSDATFIQEGGDSILAVRIALEFEDCSGNRFPDLVNLLLDNTSNKDILSYITSENPTRQDNKKQKLDVSIQEVSSNSVPSVIFASRGRSFSDGTSNWAKISSLKHVWKIDLAKCIDATPLAVFSDVTNRWTVYVGSHKGFFVSVDLDSGQENWKTILPGRIEASASVSTCGKYIFIGCYDGRMYCLASADGSIKWSFETGGMIKAQVCVFNDSIIFGSYDKSVYCISSDIGLLIFKTHLSGSITTTACPVYLNKSKLIIVTTLTGQLVLLDSKTGFIISELNFSAPFFSSPIVVGTVLIAITVKGEVQALDLSDSRMSKLWSNDIGSPVYSSVSSLLNSIVFGCHDHKMYCIDITNGNVKWKVCHTSPVFATPCPIASMSTESNVVASLSTDGALKISDFSSGDSIFEENLNFSDNFSSPVVINSKIIFGSRDNFLYCFEMN